MANNEIFAAPGFYVRAEPLQIIVVWQPPHLTETMALVYPISPTEAVTLAALLQRAAASSPDGPGQVSESLMALWAHPRKENVQ